MLATDVYQVLEHLGISYEKIRHPALSRIEAFHQAGITFPGESVKCLFLKDRKGKHFYLLIIDELKTTDLSALAQQIQESRLSFASENQLFEHMQLKAGSVNPFSLIHDTEKKIQVLIDQDLDRHALIGFHPCINTETLCLSYTDFEKYLEYTGHGIQYVSV